MADYQVLWTDAARLDLIGIVDFIAQDDAAAALAVLERIETRCQTLDTLPQRGRIVPEMRSFGILMYRELIIGAWRMIYRHTDDHVHVMAVLDARRDLASLLLERLVR